MRSTKRKGEITVIGNLVTNKLLTHSQKQYETLLTNLTVLEQSIVECLLIGFSDQEIAFACDLELDELYFEYHYILAKMRFLFKRGHVS